MMIIINNNKKIKNIKKTQINGDSVYLLMNLMKSVKII